MHIVVIDRHPRLAAWLQMVLAREGYVSMAWPPDGDAGRAAWPSAPHLVLVDLSAAGAEDGAGLWSLLDDDPSLRALPRVLCAADLAQLDRHAAYLHTRGCLILPQPVQPAMLLRVLAALDVTSPPAEARAQPVPASGARRPGGGWLARWLARWLGAGLGA